MTPETEQLLDAVLALPEEDRFELAEALAASLHPDDRPPFDESWRAVIERRVQEIEEGKVIPVPWSEVKRRAGEILGG